MLVSDDSTVRRTLSGTPPCRGVAGNGHEELARAVETFTRDDSFALKHSILQHGDLEMEKAPCWWPMIWPFVYVIGTLLRLVILAYRRWANVSNIRRLVGPKTLNVIMGWFIHPFVRVVREGVTTSAALDAFYAANRYFPAYFKSMLTKPWRILYAPGTLLCWLVSNFPGPRAVRNRLRVVYLSLVATFDAMANEGRQEIKVAEMACGSAEAEIFALWALRRARPEVKIHLTLVDLSKSSLRRAMRLAEALGVADSVTVVTADLKKYTASLAEGTFDVIGIVGFFDYRPVASIVELATHIRRALRPGGEFFGAHIGPHKCSFATEHFIGWPGLVRRTEQEYCALLQQGTWSKEEIETVVEPIGEHIVSVAKKAA